MPEVYINARFLTQPITGVQRFGIELSRQLRHLLPKAVFVTPANVLHTAIANELGAVTVGKQNSHVWEQLELPLYLKKKGNPLLLNLANTAPLYYKNKVVTIHDLAFKHNPAWFSKPFYLYYNFLLPRIASNSRKIITVTNSIKQEINEKLNIDAAKIAVVSNAAATLATETAPETAISKHVSGAYLLAVSSLDPRKNFVRLLKAFASIENKEVKLLMIGGSNKVFADQELQHLLEITPHAQALGYVSDAELKRLYQDATAFIYPSLYEGFGIPNIEAMSLGCPVITSDIDAIKEVCGDAALYVDPYKVSDIAAKINILLADKALKQELQSKGLEQALRYSWENSAQKVMRIITSL